MAVMWSFGPNGGEVENVRQTKDQHTWDWVFRKMSRRKGGELQDDDGRPHEFVLLKISTARPFNPFYVLPSPGNLRSPALHDFV